MDNCKPSTNDPAVNQDSPGEYLVYFAQIHEKFRKAELESLARLYGIGFTWMEYSNDHPFAIISLPTSTPSLELPHAAKLISRSILTRGIYKLWGQSTTYASLHSHLKSNTTHLWQDCMSKSFKFEVECFNGKRSQSLQRNIIESFAYLSLDGAIKMHDPEQTFAVFEHYSEQSHSEPQRVLFGKLVGVGARSVVEKYDLKKRNYIGTTSMDAELALVTANMTLSAPGKIVYDPFVGTGSFLVSCSHFGAMTVGSDIDGRQIRGKKGRSVLGNFKQYGIVAAYLDSFVADLTNSPVRKGRFLDAIVCDPPYGVREGLKVLGCRDLGRGKEPAFRDGELRHLQPDYVPPKKPYSFLAMLDDILQFAAESLVPGGRLCFWMPTANEELPPDPDSNSNPSELEIPTHPQLRLESVCVQEFNKWSRRLLTYSLKEPNCNNDNDNDSVAEQQQKRRDKLLALENGKVTADELNGFRKKYFEGFKQKPS